jgi:hypothetical protein
MCVVLANDIAEWSEAAIEQRTTKKGDHRGHVGRLGRTSYPHPPRTPHVS